MEKPPEIPGMTLYQACGRGGGGTVWIGSGPDRICRAVKIISPGTAADRERQAVAEYKEKIPFHQALINILCTGSVRQSAYYVMELADNAAGSQELYLPDTLAWRLLQGCLLPEGVLILMRQIVSGVRALHDRGYAHRDLKPENMLFVDGCLKISDPELLCPADRYSLGGTPEYSPPEPVPAGEADIYALGKMLYCMFTGEGPDAYPVLPEDFPVGRFGALNRIAMRCCDRSGGRYRNIRELQEELDRAF